jgi:hypothetical protein
MKPAFLEYQFAKTTKADIASTGYGRNCGCGREETKPVEVEPKVKVKSSKHYLPDYLRNMKITSPSRSHHSKGDAFMTAMNYFENSESETGSPQRYNGTREGAPSTTSFDLDSLESEKLALSEEKEAEDQLVLQEAYFSSKQQHREGVVNVPKVVDERGRDLGNIFSPLQSLGSVTSKEVVSMTSAAPRYKTTEKINSVSKHSAPVLLQKSVLDGKL